MGGGGGGESIWRRAANRICFSCAVSSPSPETILRSSVSTTPEMKTEEVSEDTDKAVQSLCAICLDPLSSSGGAGGAAGRERRIFTAAECAHSFHFACIASNVRHGSVTCPICRAYWSHLPRDLTAFARPHPPADPILRILDDSIATSRVNRRSSLIATRYDDDPVAPPPPHHHPRLHLSLLPSALSVRLAGQEPTDVVLVVSPNGPHIRLLKQSMALVVFSLRPSDRLAIVVTSSAAASRAFPLRCMSPEGKRVALHVIDRTVYLGDGDPAEGLRKGAKILSDRAYRNPISRIIHISDSPTRGGGDVEVAGENPVHRFFVGYGFGASNGLVMHEFEEFLVRLMGGEVRDVVLSLGGEEVRFGGMRVGEERRVALDLDGGGGCNYVYMGYSYVEGAGAEERRTTGQVAVVVGEEWEEEGDKSSGGSGGRRSSSSSNVERWDYLDPFMARRWAKHLHGYKL